MWYASLSMYIKKKGNQHKIKDPIISPSIKVALFSFFLATLLFSLSGSRGFCTLGTTCSTLSTPPPPWSVLRFLFAVFRPNIGLHKRSLRGLTTVHRATTPESELLGSNSLTMSVSMPTEGWRARARAAACCWSSPFTERVDPRNGQAKRALRVWAPGSTWNFEKKC